MEPIEYVTLPKRELLEFFGKMALPPWTDEHGQQVGSGIDCAPIASEIADWIETHDVTGVLADGW